MMTAHDLDALSDTELGVYASGGYGPKKRNEFYASLRDAFRKAKRVEANLSPVEQFRESVALEQPAAS